MPWPATGRFCGAAVPSGIHGVTDTADRLFYTCVNTSSISNYTQLAVRLWGLASPAPSTTFTSRFAEMYSAVNAVARTRAAQVLYSFFSCRTTSRWPLGAADDVRQLQYYEPHVAGAFALDPTPIFKPLPCPVPCTAVRWQCREQNTHPHLACQGGPRQDLLWQGQSVLDQTAYASTSQAT